MNCFSAPRCYQNILFWQIAPSRALSKMAEAESFLRASSGQNKSRSNGVKQNAMNMTLPPKKKSGGQKKRSFRGMEKWREGDSE